MAAKRVALVGPDLVVANVVLVDGPWPAPAGMVAIDSATAAPGDVFDPVQGRFLPNPGALAALRAAVRDEVQARRNALMARGAPYAGKRVEVDDASRANLAAVVLAAKLALDGLSAWPADMSDGWIAADNALIPLGTPGDAIALGLSVMSWYSSLIRHARSVKDAVAAAEDPRAAAAAFDWSPWEA